jgi:hypothetical protein
MTEDDDVMDRLRHIATEVDPPPADVVDNARAALSMRRIDEEIATLLMDSALETGVVRGSTQDVRLLSFETSSVSVELQAEVTGDRMSLRGLVTGAGGDVTIEAADQRRTVPVDAEGWFTARDLPRGPTRLRLRANDGRAVTTSWTLL